MRTLLVHIASLLSALIVSSLIFGKVLLAQQPFSCEGQMFAISENGQSLISLYISPGNNAIVQSLINPMLPKSVSVLGFRATDGLLYGIGSDDQRLYRMDANGDQEDLGSIGLKDDLNYLAGEITPDGQYFVIIASGSSDNELIKIDLENNYDRQSFPISTSSLTSDISFDPYTGQTFGFDRMNKQLALININTATFTNLQAIGSENEISSIYFNTFGELQAFGTALDGIIGAVFNVNKATGIESLFTTTGLLPVEDMTACPYGIGIRNTIDPQFSFPCNNIKLTYQIANASPDLISDVDLIHSLPMGFEFLSVTQNSFGGMRNMQAPLNILEITDMNLSKGIKTIVAEAEIGDITGGEYKFKAILENLPLSMGSSITSDDANTIVFGDSTSIMINRFEEDSINYNLFLCLGESTNLNASEFGNNILWSDGSNEPIITVGQQGSYSLEAASGCQSLYVNYDVVTATCPYTIELEHSIIPDTIFPCSQIIFRYYLENDTGLDRYNVVFLDTLPSTITLIDILPNPYGGTLVPNTQSNVVEIRDMVLVQGIDSFDIIVELGDIPPGTYFNGAEINNLPIVLGEKRFSDDPQTAMMDDTKLEILGVDSDTFFIDTIICEEEILLLDVSLFGTNPIWPDGSTDTFYAVVEEGFYEVKVFDGCEPSLVYFNVESGPTIEASIDPQIYEIYQGDSIQLYPAVNNSGDSLSFYWKDPLMNSLSCYDCANPTVRPLYSTSYTLYISNESCRDSLIINVEVDASRRIYAPNVFSPNGDGINDFFYLQSPNFEVIHNLKIIYDSLGKLGTF